MSLKHSSPALSCTSWPGLHCRCLRETRRRHMCWPGRAGETSRSDRVIIFFVCEVWVDGCYHSVTLTCDILQFWQETVPELALLGSKHPECLWQASVKRDILLMFQREWQQIRSLHAQIPETSSKEINQKVSLWMRQDPSIHLCPKTTQAEKNQCNDSIATTFTCSCKEHLAVLCNKRLWILMHNPSKVFITSYLRNHTQYFS